MDRIEQLKAYLEATPADSFLEHALALEYIKREDDAKAESLFKALLEREPGYVGSYYHLAKLLERNGRDEEAIAVYKKGMEETNKVGDKHAYGELRGALEELEM